MKELVVTKQNIQLRRKDLKEIQLTYIELSCFVTLKKFIYL